MKNFPLEINDQMGRTVRLSAVPKRIISLVPSITELLVDLGLEAEIVGVTKFCIHPSEINKIKTSIGGTKNIHLDKVAALNPDLIIGNKEENTKEAIEALEKDFNVFMTDVNTYEDALMMINLIGTISDRKSKSDQLLSELKETCTSFNAPWTNAIYLIWKNPFLATGKDTFIDDMMKLAGIKNLIVQERYPEITKEIIHELKPQLILLSTEPYPFNNNDLIEFKDNFKHSKTTLVDGEMFSWYGSRLLKSFEYFKQLKNDLEQK